MSHQILIGPSLVGRISKAFARLTVSLACFSAIGLTSLAAASGEPGKPAPAVDVTDLNGKPVSLADHKGRWVVLEWTNPECPFVQKHYKSDNMQATQREVTEKHVFWIQINSTNPNHPEFKTPAKMAEWNSLMKAAPSVATLDRDGKTGKAYSAKTTPQMVLINPNGIVVYNGAIDSIRSANAADIPKATNYVKQAVQEALSGKAVSMPSTTPYGCSIKY
jgi:hypothetical protein